MCEWKGVLGIQTRFKERYLEGSDILKRPRKFYLSEESDRDGFEEALANLAPTTRLLHHYKLKNTYRNGGKLGDFERPDSDDVVRYLVEAKSVFKRPGIQEIFQAPNCEYEYLPVLLTARMFLLGWVKWNGHYLYIEREGYSHKPVRWMAAPEGFVPTAEFFFEKVSNRMFTPGICNPALDPGLRGLGKPVPLVEKLGYYKPARGCKPGFRDENPFNVIADNVYKDSASKGRPVYCDRCRVETSMKNMVVIGAGSTKVRLCKTCLPIKSD